jgi:hypothetical protein
MLMPLGLPETTDQSSVHIFMFELVPAAQAVPLVVSTRLNQASIINGAADWMGVHLRHCGVRLDTSAFLQLLQWVKDIRDVPELASTRLQRRQALPPKSQYSIVSTESSVYSASDWVRIHTRSL